MVPVGYAACQLILALGQWKLNRESHYKWMRQVTATTPRNKSRNNQSLAPPGKNGFVELIRIWKCFDISS